MVFRRNREFLKFWVGESVSLLGSNVTLLALPLTIVLTLGANAQQLGILRFYEYAPYVLFTLLFGAWADRLPRRSVMITANAARALLVGAIPMLAVAHALRLGSLYAIAFAIGVFTVLFDVCWPAFVPEVTRRDDLVEANATLATSSAAAEVAGPGLAGTLVQLLTAPIALTVNALSYLVSVVSLATIRLDDAPAVRRRGTSLIHEIGEGLQFVLANPYLRTLLSLPALWNFLQFCAETAFLLYAVRELGFSAGLLGLVMSAGAAGGVVGAGIAGRLQQRFPLGPLMTATFVCGSAPWIILPSARGPIPVLAAAFVSAYFFIRAALGVWAVLALTFRQSITPDRLLSRSTASMRLVTFGIGSLGAIASGYLAAALGVHTALWVASIAYLALLVPLALSPLPRLRSLPTYEEDAPQPLRDIAAEA